MLLGNKVYLVKNFNFKVVINRKLYKLLNFTNSRGKLKMKTKLFQGDYKIFEGSYNSRMPLLVQEGLQPLTTKDLMQYRLQAIQSKDKDEIDFWLCRYFDTVTGLCYHEGKLVVVPSSDLLLNIKPESKLDNGCLILSLEQYKQLSKQNEVIKRNEVISGKDLIKKQKQFRSGDIVLARIGDEVTLKRFIYDKGRTYLKPENPACRNIAITHDTYFLGKMIANLGKR